MKTKEITLQRNIKHKGKEYKGIRKIIKSSGIKLTKDNAPEEWESVMKDYADNVVIFNARDRVSEYELEALSFIEDHGIYVHKPYDYSDQYLIYEGKVSYSPKGVYHDKNIAGGKFHQIDGVVKHILNDKAWKLEPLGMAANILNYCYLLKLFLERDNLNLIVEYSMKLQKEVVLLDFSPWELPARIGDNASISGKAAATISAKERKEKTKLGHERIIALFKEGLRTSVISKRTGLGVRQIQKIIEPYRKK